MLCVGYACVDINFSASHHPEADEKIRARSMLCCGGGPAANAAVAIARLGGSAQFCGYLGNDSFGEAHLAEFESEGVITKSITRGEAPTPVAAVTIKPDGKRSIIDYCDFAATVPEDACMLAEIAPKVLLLDGHQPLISIQLAHQARGLGIPIVLDAGSLHDGTEVLLNLVDFLITSEKFAKQYSQEEDPRLALSALDGLAPVIGITWGDQGIYWQDETGNHHTEAFSIEALDTTGAGDAFHGAFALGLARKYTLKENMRYASAVGALTCLKIGARKALPYRKAVDALLKV